MSAEKYYEDMLFNYESSHRTYYRGGEIKPLIRTVYTAKPLCSRNRPPSSRDTHTLVDWKDARVPPFNLFHKPKDIVRTNPWDTQQSYEKPIDVDFENAKKRRPRVILTPAVSLDDVPAEQRKLLIDEMYTTSAQRTTRDRCSGLEGLKAPLPAKQAPANPFSLHKLLPPYVSPEWRMQSVAWDNKQLRAYCDPCREFYLARTTECDACNFTAMRDAQMKLEKQMKMKRHENF